MSLGKAVTQAFYDALVGDGEILAMVGTYPISDQQELPNVFTADPIPERARPPYVMTVGNVVSDPEDDKTRQKALLVRDVTAFGAADGNVAEVESLADLVRDLFHRRPASLKIDGWQVVVIEASGPIANDRDDLYGRTVTVTAQLQEG